MKKIISIALASCALFGAQAGATTIGFEGVVSSSGATVPVTPYTESGFTFTDLQAAGGTNGIFGANASNSNGSSTFAFCSYNTGCGTNVFVSLAAADASAFSLSSIAAGNWQSGGAGSIDLIGHLVGGGTVSASIATGTAWATYAISGFTNLSSIDFYGRTVYAVAIDNLELNAPTNVPEPASAALLGLGLAGLAATRRRKAK